MMSLLKTYEVFHSARNLEAFVRNIIEERNHPRDQATLEAALNNVNANRRLRRHDRRSIRRIHYEIKVRVAFSDQE